MEEWKEYKIGDIAKTNTSQYSLLENWETIQYLDTGSITKNQISGIEKFLGNTDLPSRARRKVKHGDIVYSCVRPNLCHYGYIDNPPANLLVSTGFVVITVDPNLADARFIYYFLTQDNIVQSLHAIGEQAVSTYPSIKASDIEDLSISLPPLPIQHKITSILKSLDDKIEVNRRINENLEQQAQALFKSWFVDFEPFKECEFVESELGMIPKGWRVGHYDEIIETTISGDWGKEKLEGNYTHKVACVRGCDFQDIKNGLRGKTPERYILEKNYQNKHFCDKDILVEISGGTATVSTGRVCPVSQQLIDNYDGDIVCTNFCKVVRPLEGYGAFLYYSWLYKYNNKVMFGYENGTSGIKNFRIKDFISLESVVIPPQDIMTKFETLIDIILKQMQTRGKESRRLASLRDTLLPRLMSGELTINDIGDSL